MAIEKSPVLSEVRFRDLLRLNYSIITYENDLSSLSLLLSSGGFALLPSGG